MLSSTGIFGGISCFNPAQFQLLSISHQSWPREWDTRITPAMICCRGILSAKEVVCKRIPCCPAPSSDSKSNLLGFETRGRTVERRGRVFRTVDPSLTPHCGALQTVAKHDNREGGQKGHVLSGALSSLSQLCIHQAHLLPSLLNVPSGWESQLLSVNHCSF